MKSIEALAHAAGDGSQAAVTTVSDAIEHRPEVVAGHLPHTDESDAGGRSSSHGFQGSVRVDDGVSPQGGQGSPMGGV